MASTSAAGIQPHQFVGVAHSRRATVEVEPHLLPLHRAHGQVGIDAQHGHRPEVTHTILQGSRDIRPGRWQRPLELVAGRPKVRTRSSDGREVQHLHSLPDVGQGSADIPDRSGRLAHPRPHPSRSRRGSAGCQRHPASCRRRSRSALLIVPTTRKTYCNDQSNQDCAGNRHPNFPINAARRSLGGRGNRVNPTLTIPIPHPPRTPLTGRVRIPAGCAHSASPMHSKGTAATPGAGPQTATPTLTPAKGNCCCRELGDSCGATRPHTPWGMTPTGSPNLDPGRGDSQSRDLKFSEEAFVEC